MRDPLPAELLEKLNRGRNNFRLFGPDETASNRLEPVDAVSGKAWICTTGAGRHGSSCTSSC